jgi:hypothetical protein
MKRFIVAEASKTWTSTTPKEDLLSNKFELIINTNLERGYILKDWKVSSVIGDNQFTETIIAIFELQVNE